MKKRFTFLRSTIFSAVLVLVAIVFCLNGVRPASAATVGIDNSHIIYGSYNYPAETLFSANVFSRFRETITALGHVIVPLTSFSQDDLSSVDIAILAPPTADYSSPETHPNLPYSESEMTAIQALASNRAVFLSDSYIIQRSPLFDSTYDNQLLLDNILFFLQPGGALFVSEWGTDNYAPDFANWNDLLEPFGVEYADQGTDYDNHDVEHFVEHTITWGVSKVLSGGYQNRITANDPSVDLTVYSGADDILAAYWADENLTPDPPTCTGMNTITVGDTLQITVTATDPNPGDTVSLSVLGLPSFASFSWTPGNPATGLLEGIPTIDDIGMWTVQFSASDDGTPSLTSESSCIITVENQPPVSDPNGPYQAPPESTITLDGSGSYDPDENSGDFIVSWEWDLDNDGQFDDSTGETTTFTVGATVGEISVICLKVTDSYGESDDSCTTVEVIYTNQAPYADPNGPYTGDEGSSVAFDGTGSSDPDGDSLTYYWEFGDGQTGSGPTPSSIYADNGNYDVWLTVTDPSGETDTQITTAEIANVAPTITSLNGPSDPVEINNSIAMSAAFTDPGILDTHTGTWDWGDSTTSVGTVSEAGGSGTVTGSHTYGEAGVYAVTLTVTDNDGGSATDTFQFVVVYDPSGGFVTGGGWLDSQAGAYKPDPSLTGKANFGFVSKYKKGATAPTGNTEYQFHAGDLNFHSSSYEWLVVTGSDYAMFKGSGTINGMGDYKFRIWAGDSNPDTFRIKIWEEDLLGTEIVIYDNGFDQEIGGGSIVTHTK